MVGVQIRIVGGLCAAGIAATAAGCTFEDSGSGRPAPGLGAQASTGGAVDPDQLTGGLDTGQLSGISAAEAGETGSTSDAGGTADTGGDGLTSAADTEGAEGGVPGESSIRNVNFSGCIDRLWCEFEGGTPAGGPFFVQECFTSPVAPPFAVTRIDFVPNELTPELLPFRVEIRAYDADEPGDAIWSGTLENPEDLVEGALNAITFDDDNPIVGTETFCAGFFVDAVDSEGGLGVGFAPGMGGFASSYVAGCGLSDWKDLRVDPGAVDGGWCVGVRVAPLN